MLILLTADSRADCKTIHRKPDSSLIELIAEVYARRTSPDRYTVFENS